MVEEREDMLTTARAKKGAYAGYGKDSFILGP
jgi:hypothetical protein